MSAPDDFAAELDAFLDGWLAAHPMTGVVTVDAMALRRVAERHGTEVVFTRTTRKTVDAYLPREMRRAA